MELFAELSIVIVVATGMAVIMRFLRQPLIIGHVLTGLIVGPFVFGIVQSAETFALLGEIGIAILLFTVGLHLNPDLIRTFGRVSVVAAICQVTITSLTGFMLAAALGFGPIESFYIGVALAFSSTIIVMKLISDKGDMDVLYAKIAVGFLLVQDLIAVLLLLGVPMFSSEALGGGTILRFLVSGAALIGFVYLASRFFVSRASRFISESQEFLFLFAITWGIGIAALFKYFGFSLESGALIAGVALASLPARREISSRLTPLRDFFIVMFFVYLGSQMQLGAFSSMLPIALALSTLVLVGNPIIVMMVMGLLGYKKKTGMMLGITVAQVSEFSLILVALAVGIGHVPESVLSVVTLTALITIFVSSYLTTYAGALYRFLAPYLSIFEMPNAKEPHMHSKSHDVILFGCNRIGSDFLESLREKGTRFLVVDHDPETVERLEKDGIDALYGDATDWDFLDTFEFDKVELVISTIPDSDTNQLIHRAVKQDNPGAVVMVVAHRVGDALSHYGEGVDYVILPHFLGGKYAAELVVKFGSDKEKYDNLRSKHIEHLRLRISAGHEHPNPNQ